MRLSKLYSQSKQIEAIIIIALSALLFSYSSCSPRKTTRTSLFYHTLTTRYNILYNAQKLFDETYQEQLIQSQDTLSPQIPTIPGIHSNDISYTPVVSKLHSAIGEHSLRSRPKWIKRNQLNGEREYNPALFEVWILLGKSLLYSGKLQDAEQIFSFTNKLYHYDKEKSYRARIWQARALLAGDRAIEARSLIADLKHLSPQEIEKLKDIYYILSAEYAINGKDWDKAIESIRLAIKHTKYKAEKARLYYLLGQLYELKGKANSNKDALQAYLHAYRHSSRGYLYTDTKKKIQKLSSSRSSILHINDARSDTTTHAVVLSRESEILVKEYAPINWGRIFEQDTISIGGKISTSPLKERSCILEVPQDDIPYADLFFILSSHNFINFTQESLLITNSTRGTDVYTLEIIGFSSERQHKLYRESLQAIGNKHGITIHLRKE